VPVDISHPQPLGGVESLLEEACERTLGLIDGVGGADLDRVHDPLMSPLSWDLGHIAAFEDLWVCRETGAELLREDLADVYDAFETPRAGRSELAYLRHDEALAYVDAVRARTRDALGRVSPSSGRCSSSTSISTTRRCSRRCSLRTPASTRPSAPGPDGEAQGGTVLVEAGVFGMGELGEGFAYDNERPRHEVELPAFRIDRAPVTNAAFAEFVTGGGYERRELWSAEDWQLRASEAWEHPLYWTGDGGVCGTIGNLYPVERARFLQRIRRIIGLGDRLIIGTDLVKDRAVLEGRCGCARTAPRPCRSTASTST
jgi:gamma-glutamyl hercynylcysteine S-oxide synthase